ncbi:unnamed protein product [Orchesella dallaii]|uniref:DM13 domain-containing protein n=1 Tax=Orchesella dallaii TaxID=48710 RepID=A0ABP1RFN6_9HEXA
MIHFIFIASLLPLATPQVSLGKFVYNGHGLGGEVILLNERQYRIKGFSYDGGGPAVWHTGMPKGTVGVYSDDAYAFRNENDNCGRLNKKYNNRDITITIPKNLKLSRDFSSIAVYCYRFCHNFGHVKVPGNLRLPAAPKNLPDNNVCKPDHPGCSRDRTRDNAVCEESSGKSVTCPAESPLVRQTPRPPKPRTRTRSRNNRPTSIGRFISYANGVTGEVQILNDRQFRVKRFSYTGARGKTTYFLLMEKNVAGIYNVKGFAVPDEAGKCDGLKSYKNRDVVITIPEDIKISRDIGAIAVYDYEACKNFAHIVIPPNLNVPPAPPRLPNRKVCLPHFRPCSRNDTANNGVCKVRGKDTTCN